MPDRPTRRSLLLPLALVLFSCTAMPAEAQPQPRLATAPLTIVTARGSHRFTVEVAQTPAEMERGLMFRTSLMPDAGMLFVYPEPTVAQMWMKNTLIPLDMLFVDARGRIVHIAERTVPQSLDVIAAAARVRAVIELAGGTAARLGITPGDEVRYPLFGNAR